MIYNCTFTITRSGYAGQGHLRGAYPAGLEQGEAGAIAAKYSHLLYVDPGVDIRDGYSYGAIAGGDTIFIPNSTDSSKVQYNVIVVELAGQGAFSMKRVYLQRQSVPSGSANI